MSTRKAKRSAGKTTAPNISSEAGRKYRDIPEQALATATPETYAHLSREELEHLIGLSIKICAELEKTCGNLIRGAAVMSKMLALVRANPGPKFRSLRDQAIADIHLTAAEYAAVVVPAIEWPARSIPQEGAS